MHIRYRVELSEAERVELRGLIAGGNVAVRRVKRAQILLAADAGLSDEAIPTGRRRCGCGRGHGHGLPDQATAGGG